MKTPIIKCMLSIFVLHVASLFASTQGASESQSSRLVYKNALESGVLMSIVLQNTDELKKILVQLQSEKINLNTLASDTTTDNILHYFLHMLSPTFTDHTKKNLDAEKSHQAILQLLVNYNADIEAPDYNGDTPLHKAVDYGLQEVVDVLLANNANIKAQNEKGETPLHLGVNFTSRLEYCPHLIEAHSGILKLLLDYNALIETKDKQGATSLHAAIMPNHEDAFKLAPPAPAEPRGALLEATIANVVKILLNKRAEVNAQTNLYATPLSLAAHQNYSEVATLLLNNGARMHVPTIFGLTPFELAVIGEREKMLKLLSDYYYENKVRGIETTETLEIFLPTALCSIVKLYIEGYNPFPKAYFIFHIVIPPKIRFSNSLKNFLAKGKGNRDPKHLLKLFTMPALKECQNLIFNTLSRLNLNSYSSLTNFDTRAMRKQYALDLEYYRKIVEETIRTKQDILTNVCKAPLSNKLKRKQPDQE